MSKARIKNAHQAFNEQGFILSIIRPVWFLQHSCNRITTAKWTTIQDTENSHHISLQALIFQGINNEWSLYLRLLVETYFMILTVFACAVYILQTDEDFGREICMIYVWKLDLLQFAVFKNINITQKLSPSVKCRVLL